MALESAMTVAPTIALVAATLFLLTVAAGRARAAPTADDQALATVLFREGRALLLAGHLSEACPKLEESQRLDPSGGTILNLALCHEQQGHLARAWSEYNEAAIVARRDGRNDRAVEAQAHVAALEPRLSRLTIVVPSAARVEGLRIERDGRELGPGAWSTPIPVDGGEHSVRASALGRDPFVATVAVADEQDARRIEIPVLATPVTVVTPPRVLATAAEAPPSFFTPTRMRRIGIGAAGAGVALLGLAAYVLRGAIRARDDSNANCFSDGCNPTGVAQRNDAVSRGNWATALGLSGAVLLGTGATSFYFAGRF